jgi:ribosomal protein S18 acetylase RimI-like enzyme
MDVRIREAVPADARAITRVHIDTWRTAYAGIVPAEHLAGLSYERREAVWVQILSRDEPAQSNFVAETGSGEIVGFAGGGPEREGDRVYRAELYAIYLLREHQRRGTGRRLARAVARGLLAAGFDSMLLWVLEDNHPARRFYESLGGEQVGRKTIEIGGSGLVEVSYGWRDITGLAGGHVGPPLRLECHPHPGPLPARERG